jgi:uncharacterized iron-regulated protein
LIEGRRKHMPIRNALAALAALSTTLAAPAAAQTQPHPLVGQILDTRTGAVTAITDPALVRALFPCGAITLLGEVHDNPEHHRMRGELVRRMVANGRALPASCGRGAFVFEQIGAEQQMGLDRFYAFDRSARRLATAGDLFRFLGWDASGWPDKKLFHPLMSEAALPSDRARALGLEQPMAEGLGDALLNELEASHCGLVPRAALGGMAMAQRYRDAYLAEASLRAANAQGSTVLFAGNGHVRRDRGIPADLRRIAPDRTVVSVTFVEVEDGRTDPASYGPRDPTGKPATGYVVFAAPAPREDPCELMRRRMKK